MFLSIGLKSQCGPLIDLSVVPIFVNVCLFFWLKRKVEGGPEPESGRAKNSQIVNVSIYEEILAPHPSSILFSNC